MEIVKTPFEGLLVLQTMNFQDSRGGFQKLFNYDFFKVGNSMSSRVNTITSSLACTLTLAYQPVIRDAP